MSANLLLEELVKFDRLPKRNPDRKKTANFLAYVQGKGTDLQSFTESQWSDVADEMGLSDDDRLDFLEEVASWL